MEEITVTFTVTGEKVLALTIYGKPVPYQRTRSVTINGVTRHYNPENYTRYRKYVASEILKTVGRENLPKFPPPNHKDRKEYIEKNRYSLAVNVYRQRRSGDKDNFLKGLSDSLQDSGILADDEQLDSSCIERETDSKNPRITFCLIKLPVPVKVKKERKKNKQE